MADARTEAIEDYQGNVYGSAVTDSAGIGHRLARSVDDALQRPGGGIVAVLPEALLALLDRLEAAEARVRELEGAVAHTHTTAPGTGTLTHTHRKGDVPHGHHGWRYGAPVPEEPESTPAAEPRCTCETWRRCAIATGASDAAALRWTCPTHGEQRHPPAADTQEARRDG